jgi:hypothetical protein
MRDAKGLAAETVRTFPAVVEDALRELVSRTRSASGRGERIVLPTFGSGGLMPGIDLDNSAGLLDIMEEGDAPV